MVVVGKSLATTIAGVLSNIRDEPSLKSSNSLTEFLMYFTDQQKSRSRCPAAEHIGTLLLTQKSKQRIIHTIKLQIKYYANTRQSIQKRRTESRRDEDEGGEGYEKKTMAESRQDETTWKKNVH